VGVAEAQIHVTEAQIGCLDIKQNEGNLTTIVGNACNGKTFCSFKAPTEQQYKAMGVQAHTRTFCTQAMEIEYQCGSGPTQSVTVPGDAWTHPPAVLECQVTGSTGGGGAATPGSCIATHLGDPIPEEKKWYPVQIATSHPNAACPSRNVQMVDLHGWIHAISPTCNGEDPDWHYLLELDTAWAASQGIDLSRLFRVGDIYWNAYKASNTGAREKAVSTPGIELEVFGWRPGDHPGQSPPAGWGFTTADSANCPNVYWPYNPLNPKAGQSPLTEGEYVRVVGSLVTDQPHEDQAGLPTFACGNFGVLCSDTAKDNDIKMDWGNGINNQATDPARWTEIHPPDLIESLPDPGHKETFRGVAVLSEHCLVGHCGSQTIDEDIAPPAACPSGYQLGYQEMVGTGSNETNFATIEEGNGPGPGSSTGAKITVGPSSIHVHVMVRGQSANGAYGRFKALYRVYCFVPPPPPPTMILNVQRGSDQHGKWVLVTAKDSKNGRAVNGTVTYGVGTLARARITEGEKGASGKTGEKIYYGTCTAEIIIPPTLHTPGRTETSPCVWEVRAAGYVAQTFK
jgi:hypothetical protein